MPSKLEKALRKQDKQTQKKRQELSGTMGVVINGVQTVEVPNRSGFVYVLLNNKDQELIQAFNDKVSGAFGLAVVVVWNINRYEVLRKDDLRYSTWNSNYLPKHGNQHSFNPDGGGGGDVTFIYGKQFVPLSLTPSGTFGAPVAIIAPYAQQEDGWHYIDNTTTPNITTHKPTDNTARMVLVALDWTTRTPQLIIGSQSFSASLTGSADVIPYLPATTGAMQIPIAGVRLVSGTTAITWQNIYDVRQYFHPIFTGTSSGGGSTGTSGGISGVVGWDEGIPLGTGTIFNFVGAGVTATRSGTVFNVNVPGSTISGSTPFAIVSSNYSETTVTNGSSNVKLVIDTEIVDDSNLVSLGSNNITVGQTGWYDFEAVVLVIVNGGSAVTQDGYFNILLSNTGIFDNTNSYHATTNGSTVQNDFIVRGSVYLDTSGGQNVLSVLVSNFTGHSLNAYVHEVYLRPSGGIGGGGGGGGTSYLGRIGIMGWDEGTPIGTGTVLNFVGGGVTATRSGSVIDVNVPSASVNTGTLDARYLRLDTSNDPLTGGLDISSNVQALSITAQQSYTSAFLNQVAHGVNSNNPAVQVTRSSDDGSKFFNTALQFFDNGGDTEFSQGTLKHIYSSGSVSVPLAELNPYADIATGTVFLINAQTPLPPTGSFVRLQVQDREILTINGSGTVFSNGTPLVKEAPADGSSYIRRNNGWILATGVSGGGGSLDVYDDSTLIVSAASKVSFNKNLTIEATGTSVFVTSPITTYFRVGVPTQLAGNFWQVPDRVYASGSLGVFNNGLALMIGADYVEQLWVSGTYQYLGIYTGTHLVHYGVPCSPQTQPPTGTAGGSLYDLMDSDSVLLLDSDGNQLLDSNG